MNNMNIVKQIREETNCPLKDIYEIIEMFSEYKVSPERQDIIDIIRYKQLVGKTRAQSKSIREYVQEIYENKYRKENRQNGEDI